MLVMFDKKMFSLKSKKRCNDNEKESEQAN